MAQATVTRSTAVVIAVIAFAAGLFVGTVILGELHGDAHQQAAAQSASQAAGQTAGPMPGQAPGMPAGQAAPSAADQGAIMELERQAVTNPNDAALWVELGNRYFDTNQPPKAIKAYERALELKPGDPNVLTDLGVMYRAAGQPENALAAFDKAIAVDPGHVPSRLNKGIVLLHDLRNSDAAIATWEALLKIQPQARTPDGRALSDIVAELKKSAASPAKQ